MGVPAVLLSCLVLAPSAPVATPARSADLEASLRQVELAFAASVADRDAERFASFLAEEAVFLGASVLRGKAAILDAWSAFFAEGGPTLEWAPEVAALQEGGELGITRGPYTLTRTGSAGESVSVTGTFTSVWRRRADGSWEILFDTGCPPCPAPEGAPGGEP